MLGFAELDVEQAAQPSFELIFDKGLGRINFSGPRASGWPEAHDVSYKFTSRLIELVRGG